MESRPSLDIVQLVVTMVTRDRVLEENEHRMLNRILVRLGLSVHEVDDILPLEDLGEAAERFRRLPEESRAATLEMLVEAALADGEVVEAERELLVVIAEAMGVDREQTEAAVARRLGAAR